MGNGSNRTGGKKGKRCGKSKNVTGKKEEIDSLNEEQGIAEIIKHNGGTPPRFKGDVLSQRWKNQSIILVKPGSKSQRQRINVGDIVLFERNIANSASNIKQEYHILTILTRTQVKQAKNDKLIVKEESNTLYDKDDIEFEENKNNEEDEIAPQERRYSISSDDDSFETEY